MKLRIVKHTNPVSNISSYVIEKRYLGLFWVGVDYCGEPFTALCPHHYGDMKSAIYRAHFLAKERRMRRRAQEQHERKVVAVID